MTKTNLETLNLFLKIKKAKERIRWKWWKAKQCAIFSSEYIEKYGIVTNATSEEDSRHIVSVILSISDVDHSARYSDSDLEFSSSVKYISNEHKSKALKKKPEWYVLRVNE